MTTPIHELGKIAALNPKLQRTLNPADPVSFVSMSGLSAERGTVVDEQIRTFQQVAKGYTPFADGDLLVAKITPCFENNKIGQAKLSQSVGFGSTEFHVIRARPDVADQRYLLHYLRQDHVRAEGERKMTGSAGQRRVPLHFLSTLPVPLPSVGEQRRIAAILDQADAVRAKRRSSLTRLNDLGRAAFLEMFGDPLGNPRGWRKMRLGDVGEVITGNTPPRSVETNYGAGIEWIKSDNINTGAYYATGASERLSLSGESVARTAHPDSILVTCIAGSPGSIGNAAMLDRKAAFNQQINAVVPRNCNPHFLYAQLRVGKKMVQEMSTDGMKGLVSKSRFEQIQVIAPPPALQARFAEKILMIERTRCAAGEALEVIDALFASLQDRAFRGEL